MISFNRFAYSGSARAPDRKEFREGRLIEYFIFSLLLHVLIVLMFGTPAGDGSSRGQKIFGALNITLNQSLSGLLTDKAAPDTPVIPVKAPAARTSVPVAEVLPLPDIPSAEVSTPPPPASELPPKETAPSPVPEVVPEAAPLTRSPINEAPPSLTREISKPVTRFVVPLPALTMPREQPLPSIDSKLQDKPTIEAPHPEVLVSPKTEAFKVPPSVAKPEAAPVVQSPAPEPLAPVKVEPFVSPQAETRDADALKREPPVQPLPSPPATPRTQAAGEAPRVEVKPLESRAAPTGIQPEIPVIPSPPREPVVSPPIDRAILTPPVENKTTALPPLPVAPQPVIPPRAEPSVTPAVQPAIQSVVKPEVKPAAVTPTITPAGPPTIQQSPPQAAPAVEQKPAPVPAASVPASVPTAVTPAERGAAAPASIQRPAAVPSTTAGTADGTKIQGTQGDKAAASAGSSSAGSSNSAAGGPSVDLETLRNQARDLGRQAGSGSGRSGVFQLQAPPVIEERTSKLAQSLEKAAKADCREAYSGMGLAAVVPLAASPFRDSGCKW